jgi:TonB family protein
MILLWMLIASLVGLAASVAALALEGASRALRRPARWPWVAGLAFSALWPVWLAVSSATPHAADGARIGTATLAPVLLTAGRAAITRFAYQWAPLDARAAFTILSLWLLASAVLLIRLVLGMRSLNRQRSYWLARQIDGVDVLVAAATGPAVVGGRRPAIVLPEWALDLDPKLRQLVLRHETEHLRSHDTVLRLLGAVLPALMPWNVALWWQASRLSLGIEVDCDARVLRGDVARERYGLLLLAIAQRQTTTMLAPALSEPTCHLERRVTAMQRSLPNRPVLSAAGLTLVASICVALACSAPSPNAPASAAESRNAGNAPPLSIGTEYTDLGATVDTQARAYGNPAPVYPESLRRAKIGGLVIVQFVIDTTGHVDTSTFKVVRSDNELLTEAVKAVLPASRFFPAELGGHHVKELVTTPFVFAVPK